jgi:hypothetical protein
MPDAAYQRAKLDPEPKPPAVYESVPTDPVPVPNVKVLEPVCITPFVKFSVPETVPVPTPVIVLAVEKVTPPAEVLLIVILLKLAVGEAVRFLKTPVPDIVWD